MQIADTAFFQVVASGVSIQAFTASICHADYVAGLVQERMDRCIAANVHAVADNTGFTVTPVTSRNRHTVLANNERQAEAPQQSC